MPDRGVIAPGSYLGNPAGLQHGPMVTQFGSLILVHTDEPISQPAWRCEGAQEFANGYRELTSWLEPPRHTDWAELPDYVPAGRGFDWTEHGALALAADPPAGVERRVDLLAGDAARLR
jgi:hypothetical protein